MSLSAPGGFLSSLCYRNVCTHAKPTKSKIQFKNIKILFDFCTRKFWFVIPPPLVNRCEGKKSSSVLPQLYCYSNVLTVQLSQEHPEKITCPSCHTDCQLGPAGVAGLLADYGVSGISDSQLDGAYCTGCKSRESSAVARCFDCSNFLCGNCVMAHQVSSSSSWNLGIRVGKSSKFIQNDRMLEGQIS